MAAPLRRAREALDARVQAWIRRRQGPDADPVRLVNRCTKTGRRHAYLRKFASSRLTFREDALNGLIPGVTKASW